MIHDNDYQSKINFYLIDLEPVREDIHFAAEELVVNDITALDLLETAEDLANLASPLDPETGDALDQKHWDAMVIAILAEIYRITRTYKVKM